MRVTSSLNPSPMRIIAFLLLGGSLIERAKAGGTGTRLPADSWQCEEYQTGGVCDLVFSAGDSVAMRQEGNQTAIQQAILEVTTFIGNMASGTCLDAQVRMLCAQALPPCSEQQGKTAVHLPCNDLCKASYDECSEYVKMVRGAGFGHVLANCGGGAEYSGNEVDAEGDMHGVNMGEGPQEYPDYYHLKPRFPVGPAVEVTFEDGSTGSIACLSSEQAQSGGGMSLGGQQSCGPGLLFFDGACQITCPHPLFSIGEYGQIYDAFATFTISYLVLNAGFLGLVMAKLLLKRFEARARGHTKRKSKLGAPKTLLARYQPLVNLACSLYALTGPGLALMTNNKESLPLACNGLPVVEPTGEMDADGLPVYRQYSAFMSVACEINRASIYAVLFGFNVLAVHLFALSKQVGSMSMVKTGTPKMVRIAEVAAAVIPFFLLVTMYSLDGLSILQDEAQGSAARWTIICGPRLTMNEELALVHIPFIVTGLVVFGLSIKLLRTFARIKKETRKTTTASRSESMDKKLAIMIKKLMVLGLLCLVLVAIFIYLTATTVSKINSLTESFNIYLVCSMNPEMASLSGLDCGTFVDRPSSQDFIVLICCQIGVPALLLLVYGNLVFGELLKSKKILNRMKTARVGPSSSTASSTPASSTSRGSDEK